MLGYPGIPARWRTREIGAPATPLLTTTFRRGDIELRFFSTITMFRAQGQRIRAPVGLDLGGETAEEIALSIIAEVQAVYTRREAGFLTWRGGPIHSSAPPLTSRGGRGGPVLS